MDSSHFENICIVCGSTLFPSPLLEYKDMPTVAQHLPDSQTVKDDTGVDLNIYQCSGCGLVQLHIEPVPYYKEVIRAVGVSKEMTEFRQRQFKEFIDNYNLHGRKILEVGSGRGEYLELMKQQGADVYGIEFSETSVEESNNKQLNVTRGFIDSHNYKIPTGPFDAFFIISFFEHVPNPGQLLRGIANNLNDGGVGILEVPNFDMMLREHLFSEFMRDHLFYFTKSTLRTTLELYGFEALDMKEVWHDYILSATVKKRQALDISSFSQDREKLKSAIDNFLAQHTSVAIWGAGHQAFAIMAMMGLGGRIKYVVDSAPFKQGKFTPASHIPIVSPDTLNSDLVDAVIIMAGSYSDEIKTILKKKYSKNIKAAILRESFLEI